MTQGAFTEVLGLEGVTEVIEYEDGNDLQLRARPGRTRYSNIVTRRGFNNNNELFDWYKKVTDGVIERKAGSVILVGDDAETEIVRFNFFEAWPCRWRSFELDGEADRVLVEEIEIVVEKIERG